MSALAEPITELPSQSVDNRIVPPVPESIADTGIAGSLIDHLILKYLYFRGELVGRDIANLLGFQFSLIDEALETMKRQHFVGVKKSLGMGNSSGVFVLTESGRNLARECLENNQYAGPAPVPLYQYTEVVRRQKLKSNWLNPVSLQRAFKHLVVEPDIMSQIGPAVNASKSFLIYGQPGNGKTALAEALFRVETEPIYMPYAVECQGNIIQIYDPIYHQKIEDEETVMSALSTDLPHDSRWFKCRRPFIITGGELTLDMLDLSFNKHSKVYDAPFQLKANNGIYLIDDFGRQKASPAEILNRWIVPMEERLDHFSIGGGAYFSVPFDVVLVFSTNLNAESLVDDALRRRLGYKIPFGPISPDLYRQIWQRNCAALQLPFQSELVDFAIEELHRQRGVELLPVHPRDLLNMIVDRLRYEEHDAVVDREMLMWAWDNNFFQSR